MATPADDDLYKKPRKPIFNLLAPGATGGDNKRRYNEARDIAYCYPMVMQAVVEGISHFESDEPMKEFMRVTGVTPDDLLRVIVKYGEFISSVVNNTSVFLQPHETACKVGLEQTNPLARYLLMARIGIAFTALFHDGYMDAFVSGIRPTLTDFGIKELVAKAFQAAKERDKIVVNTTPVSGE